MDLGYLCGIQISGHANFDKFLFGKLGLFGQFDFTYRSNWGTIGFCLAVAIERYIGICHPLKAKLLCKPKRALWVIVAICTFSILSGSCWLYIFTTKTIVLPNGVEVTVVDKRMDVKSSPHQVIYALDFLISYVLPLTVTAVLYTLIGISLRKSSKAVRQATSCT